MQNFILDGRGQGKTLVTMAINLLNRQQSHSSLFKKSIAAGVLGEWLSGSSC